MIQEIDYDNLSAAEMIELKIEIFKAQLELDNPAHEDHIHLTPTLEDTKFLSENIGEMIFYHKRYFPNGFGKQTAEEQQKYVKDMKKGLDKLVHLRIKGPHANEIIKYHGFILEKLSRPYLKKSEKSS